jgi:uncharacterized protein involved in outer membrane biogenesis
LARRRRIILGILIFLAVTIIAVVVLVPLLFDVDRYRPQVAALIEKQMGKPTVIGHLALTVVPRLSIRVDDFTLRNPAGFPQGDFVKAKRVYAVINAWELWRHQVVIKSLELEAPAINLVSTPRGNWNSDTQASPTNSDPDPPGEKPLFTLGIISSITIRKGRLSVSNLLPSGQMGPVLVAAEGITSQLWQVDLNALISRGKSDFPPPRLDWKWPGSVAYAAQATAAVAAEGRFELDTLHVLNIGVTKVESKLRLLPKHVLLEGVELKCYDGTGSGNVSFAFTGPIPRYSTQAKLSGVDMAKLLEAFPDTRGKMTGTLDATVVLDGELSHSPEPLAGMGGAGHLTIRNGRLPTLRWDQNLLQLARVANMGPTSGDPSSFSSIAVDFTIANNRIKTQKVTITGNGVEADASGSLGLAGSGSLEYQGVARVATSKNALTSLLGGLTGAALKNGKMAFPFKLTGTLKNPQFTLMPSGGGSQKSTGTPPAGRGAAAQQQKP